MKARRDLDPSFLEHLLETGQRMVRDADDVPIVIAFGQMYPEGPRVPGDRRPAGDWSPHSAQMHEGRVVPSYWTRPLFESEKQDLAAAARAFNAAIQVDQDDEERPARLKHEVSIERDHDAPALKTRVHCTCGFVGEWRVGYVDPATEHPLNVQSSPPP